METRFARDFEATMQHPLYMAHARLRPGAVTPNAAHLCLPTVVGNPGLHVALIDTQQPAVTVTDFFPGSDTSAVTTGFEDQGAAAVNFGDVNDPVDATDYATNTAGMLATTQNVLQFRGNNAGTLSGKRILRVQLQALVMNRVTVSTAQSGNAINLPIQGEVVINGTTYKGPPRTVRKADAYQTIPDLTDWTISPVTGLPWDWNEIDDILDAADADTFGLRVWGIAGVRGVRVSAYWLRVTYCNENRIGFYDTRTALRTGWDRYPNTGFLATPGGGGLP